MALPLLDAMIPAATAQSATEAGQRQLRAAFVYTPHGVILDEWVPEQQGADYEMKPILKPMEDHRDQMQIFSNMRLNTDNFVGSGHAIANATWLNGAIMKDTAGADIAAGKSVDQYIADRISQDTVLPSLQLAIEDTSNMVGVCDGTSSCGYLNTISWAEAERALPMQINPRNVFESMFGYGSTQEERLQRARTDRSLLDSVMQSAADMENRLGMQDRERLHAYLDNVREVERRIGNLEQRMSESGANLDTAPTVIPELYEEHVQTQFELMALALQTDTTRVASFMMSRELNQRTYPQIGVPEQHHGLSHHGYNEENMAKHALINAYHVRLFSEFVARLKATEDIDGNLLDNTIILYGSGMGDGNVHSHDPMSNIVVGGGAGKLRSGHHTDTAVNGEVTPHTNLLLSVLDVAGIHLDSIGDSTGRLEIMKPEFQMS